MSPIKPDFGTLNYLALILYLTGVFAIGVYCTRLNRTTNDFFRGGQRMPWWAAGLSIFATMLSSITYMAIPAKAFSGNWIIVMANLPILLLAPIVIIFFLPVYRRLDATSAYEYLEKRFNYGIRLFGTLSFAFFQIGRMAVVLYLPSLALSTVTSLDLYTSIGVMGVISILYSGLGGIKAVIWTDVVQAVVLLGGALVSFLIILHGIDGGFFGYIDAAAAHDKFRVAELDWDVTAPVLWVVFLGSMFNTLIPLTSDQSYVQRYMSTATEKAAAKAIWVNSLMAMPATFLFLGLGTAMYVYYQQNPELLGDLSGPDAIFPWFIAHELPAGLAGLVVAGVFAAAQSTVSTSINSLATVLTVDIFHRWQGHGTEKQDLRLARWLTVGVGILGLGAAFLLAAMNIESMFDTFLKLMGLTGSALAGLFLLGIFTRRANALGASTGAIVSLLMLFCVQQFTGVSFYLYAPVGMITCLSVGYIVSWMSGGEHRSLVGLTYFSIHSDQSESNWKQ